MKIARVLLFIIINFFMQHVFSAAASQFLFPEELFSPVDFVVVDSYDDCSVPSPRGPYQDAPLASTGCAADNVVQSAQSDQDTPHTQATKPIPRKKISGIIPLLNQRYLAPYQGIKNLGVRSALLTDDELLVLLQQNFPAISHLTPQRKTSGTVALYTVTKNTDPKPSFFLKITQGEKGLEEALGSMVVHHYLKKTRFKRNFFVELYAVYTYVVKGERYVMELYERALGRSFYTILNDKKSFLMITQYAYDNDIIVRAGSYLGKILGALHRIDNLPGTHITLSHADLHMGNVFYYESKGEPELLQKISFIDYGLMVSSMSPMDYFYSECVKNWLLNNEWSLSIDDDHEQFPRSSLGDALIPQRLYKKSYEYKDDVIFFIYCSVFHFGFIEKNNDESWERLNLLIKSFLKGYVDSFVPDQQADIKTYLQDNLIKCIDEIYSLLRLKKPPHNRSTYYKDSKQLFNFNFYLPAYSDKLIIRMIELRKLFVDTLT